MTRQHTPGPWQYTEGGTTAFITEADGSTVICIRTTENTTAHKNLAANAQLIAAAPDLLAALKALLVLPDFDGTQETSAHRLQVKRAAHDAIAKATGEQK